jgi:hypothetical protein
MDMIRCREPIPTLTPSKDNNQLVWRKKMSASPIVTPSGLTVGAIDDMGVVEQPHPNVKCQPHGFARTFGHRNRQANPFNRTGIRSGFEIG